MSKYLQFDLTRLAAGDIILSTAPFAVTIPALKSFAIRLLTWSPISHAAMVIDRGHLVEAVGDGVLRLSLSGALIDPAQQVRVLRLKEEFGWPSVAAQAAAVAEQSVSHSYATIAALCSLFAKLPGPSEHEHFCSHLVAQSYEAAGVKLVEPTIAGKTIPRHFLQTPKLQLITADVLHEAVEGVEGCGSAL